MALRTRESLASDLTDEEIAAAIAALQSGSASTPSASSQAGFLRNAWDVTTGPLRGLAGLTGTPAAQALRLAMPEKYDKVAAELASIEKDKAGIDLFESAAALPGAGDVLTADWDPETIPGRVGKTVSTLGLNIAGDPTSWVGVGIIPKLAKLLGGSRVGAAAKGLGGTKAMKAAAKMEAIGGPGAVGKAVKAGDPARVARAIPFSPLVGVPYLPEIAEGTATGLGESWEELRAGRYKEAAASGAGALLTGGLGALVARGAITEARAAEILKRGLKDQADPAGEAETAEATAATGATTANGSPVMPTIPAEPVAKMPFADPDAAVGVPPAAATGAPLESPTLNPPTPQGVAVQAEAAAAAAPPVPVMSPKAQAILALADQGVLTRAQVLESLGLPWKRQKAAGDSVEANLRKHLGDEEADAILAQLEPVKGLGFQRRAGTAAAVIPPAAAATPVVSNTQVPVGEAPGRGPAPTAEAAAATTVAQVPAAVAAAATTVAPAPKTKTRSKGWVDTELSLPGNREAAISELEYIAKKRGIAFEEIDKEVVKADVVETITPKPGETPAELEQRRSDQRAILYKVLAQEKNSRKVPAPDDLEDKLRRSVEQGENPAAGLLDDAPSASLTRKKEYVDQLWKHEQPVRVTFEDGTTHYDAVKGMNAGHAMYRARNNWDGAKVEAISKDELKAGEDSETRGYDELMARINNGGDDPPSASLTRKKTQKPLELPLHYDARLVDVDEKGKETWAVAKNGEELGRIVGDQDDAYLAADKHARTGVLEDPARQKESVADFKYPPGTPKDLRERPPIVQTGLTPEEVTAGTRGLQRPDQPAYTPRPQPEQPILTRERYEQTRARLAEIREMVADKDLSDKERIDLADEFADEDAMLVDLIDQAVKAGIHTQPMAAPGAKKAPTYGQRGTDATPATSPLPEGPQRPREWMGAHRPRVPQPVEPGGTAVRTTDLADQERAARTEEAPQRPGRDDLTEDAIQTRIDDLREQMATGTSGAPRRGPGPRSGLGRRLPTPDRPRDERVPPYVHAILRRAEEEGLPMEDVVDRARDHFQKEFDELSPEELSLFFSLMERNSLYFKETKEGVRATTPNRDLSPLEERKRLRERTRGPEYANLPDKIDPEVAEVAIKRLTGGSSFADFGYAPHLAEARKAKKEASTKEVEEGRGADRTKPPIQYQYDPKSAAGQLQTAMRNEHRAGIEDDLQNTMLRWVENLSRNDDRHLVEADIGIRAYERQRGQSAEYGRLREDEDIAGIIEYEMATKAKVESKRAAGKKKAESARTLRLLLTNPQALDLKVPAGSNLDAVVTGELARRLNADMRHRTANYVARDASKIRGKTVAEMEESAALRADEQSGVAAELLGIDGEDAARTRGGLTDEEAERLATKTVSEITETTPGLEYEVDFPDRPAHIPADRWIETVVSDKKLMRAYAESLAAIAQAPSSVKGASFIHKDALARMEAALGIPKTTAKPSVLQRVWTIANAINERRADSPRAYSATLTAKVVEQRQAQYAAAEMKGEVIGDTGTRVVDLEKDAGGITAKEVAKVSAPLAFRLTRAVTDFANILGMRSSFGGLLISPQLNGVMLRPKGSGTVYINPLHARLLAAAEVEKEGILAGDSAAREIDRRTATNIVDTLVHELVHKHARHSEISGDRSFNRAYRAAIQDLGHHYGALIRDVTETVTGMRTATDGFMPRYKAALDVVEQRQRQEDLNVSRTGDVAGAGKGGAAPVGDRSGGGARGPDGGNGRRAEPGGAVHGRAAEPGAGARAATGAGEGPFASGDRGDGEDGGAARGGDGVAEKDPPAASLTSAFAGMKDRRRQRLHQETSQMIGRRFAAQMAKYSPDPKASDNYLRELATIKDLPEEVKLELRKAGPGETFDVGRRVSKFAEDAMSDEQKEQLSLLLLARNHMMSRAERMTEEDVQTAARKLLDDYTVDEFVDKVKLKGLRNPADWALLDGIAAMFSKQVDEATAGVRMAKIDVDTAKASGKGEAESLKALEDARGLHAHALMRRDAAIFAGIPESTNVARMLAFRRSIIHPLTADETFRGRFLGMLRSSGIPKDKQDGFYKMLLDTLSGRAEPDEFSRAFRRAIKPGWFDKFIEFWKAGLLGLPTQIVNISSNAGFLSLTNAEKSISSYATHYFAGLTGRPRQRFISETAARSMGGKMGLAEAWSSLTDDLKNIAKLQPPDLAKRFEMGSFYDDPNLRQLYGAIGGKWGEFVRIPFKLLDAFDGFFKHIIRNQEWAAQADRLAQDSQWRSPGESTQHATARIYAELRALASNPIGHHTLWMKKDASGTYVYRHAVKAGRDASVNDTFQEALVGTPLRKVAKGWQQVTQDIPAFQLATPFTKTPYNIIAELMKRMPHAGLWAMKKWATGEIDDPAAIEAIIKSAIGTSIMATAFGFASEDIITGSGPADPKEAELLKRTGWQPRSIKIGDTYYSYSRFAPFSMMLGIAADMADAYKNKDVATGGEMFEKGVQSASANITDQSFLTGIDNLMKLLTDPKRQGATVIRQFQASLVPNIVGVVPFGHLAKAVDPVYRETEALTMSPFMAQTPGLSQMLKPQYAATGEERKRPGSPVERLLSPIARTPIRTDPIAVASAEIARVGPSIESTPLFFRVGTDKVYYTDAEREQLGRAQQKALEQVARIVRSSSYQSLPDNVDVATAGQKTKKQAIEQVLNAIRRPVVTRVNQQALRRAQREDRA